MNTQQLHQQIDVFYAMWLHVLAQCIDHKPDLNAFNVQILCAGILT
jgi:hypothetical protein